MTIDAIPRTKAVSETNAAAPASAPRPAARIETKPGPFVQFEAFVLQNFVQTIMPQEATAVFGEGTAGEVWKSMLAEKIAMQVAQAGGVGIAKMITPNAKTVANLPGGGLGGAAAMTPGTADRLIELQAASAASAGTAAASSLSVLGANLKE